MSSSFTTAVPSGLITTDWCIQNSGDADGKPNQCADSGKNPSDYGTICCAGDIVDTASDLYRFGNANKTINLDTLVCCVAHGPQQGGLQPIATDRTQCTQGSPTPLASFAATNTANAAPWHITYSGASQSIGASTTVIGDFIPQQSPMCLWVYTKTGVAMRNVTVSAADATTLPAASTDVSGYPTTTGSFAPSNTAESITSQAPTHATAQSSAISSSSTSTTTPASSTSGGASVHVIGSMVYLCLVALGFVRAIRP